MRFRRTGSSRKNAVLFCYRGPLEQSGMDTGTTDMLGMVAAHINLSSVSATEEASKKIRKPYTITKSRESWTEQEHDKFLEALQLFDRDWKKIEAFVGSKSVIQIRSHAQKYFLKVQKNGTGEHVPPPRPKRKSAQPYPQKAAKTALVTQQVSRDVTPVSQTEPVYALRAQPCAIYMPPVSSSPAVSAWAHHTVPPGNVGFMTEGIPATGFGATSVIPAKDQSSSNGGSSTSNWQQQVIPASQGNQETCLRATPDFAEVYGFIGSVFDPTVTGHLKRLKEMAPINRETVLLLMRNLSINLSSPDFEEHKLFLSVYDMDLIDTVAGVGSDMKDQAGAPCVAPQLSSDVGDDTSVSGQPGSPQVSESTDEDSQSEAVEQKPPIQVYAQGTTELPQQRHPYDGGGGGMSSAAGVSKSFCSIPCSSQLENKPPVMLQHRTLRIPGGAEFSSGSEVYGFGAQGGSFEAAGEAEAEGVDMWWS